METYRTVFCHISSYGNLYNAFQKAQKGKRQKDYVIEFESNLDNNLRQLKYELEDFTYHPSPLKEFIVRDPKTRKIGASNFRDRVVYHAICNIIAPIFEKRFIHDSFANQVNKGTHKAVKRAEKFIQKFIVQHAVGGGGGNAQRI